MSKLLAYFFNQDETISQKFKIVKGEFVHAIRPHIFKNGEMLDGSLSLSLKDGGEELASKTFSNVELNSIIGNNYSHGYLTWELNARLAGRRNGEIAHEYELAITYDGTDNLKVAWIMEYENLITQTYGAGQDNDAYRPRDLEIWTYQ